MAILKLGETVMNRMGGDRATACPTETSDHSCCQPAGINHALPGLAPRVPNGIKAVDQQLITKNSGHLNSLLNHTVMTRSAAHGSFVPLGQSISDAAGQGSFRRFQQQVVVENQEVRAALEGLVTLEGSTWGVEIRECCPTGAGCSAEWNCGARNRWALP